MLDLQFVAVSMLSGQVIAELPQLVLDGGLSKTLMQADTVQATLEVDPDAPSSAWLEVCDAGKAVVIAYVRNSDGTPLPLWGGYVVIALREINTTSVSLSMQTMEGYLDSCQMGALTLTNVNQDTALVDILAASADLSWNPFTTQRTVASTQTYSITYPAQPNTSVLDALQAVSGVDGGPEWTIEWTWVASGTSGYFKPVFYYGQTIGTVSATPKVTVVSSDCQAGSTVQQDYSSGYGANTVTAFGVPPEDDTTATVPAVTVQASDFEGRPPFHYIFEPSSVVSDTPTLTTYADAALNSMQDGACSVSLTLDSGAPGKRLGVDWELGDTVGYYITGPTFPTPVTGTARVTGWELDYISCIPTLTEVTL